MKNIVFIAFLILSACSKEVPPPAPPPTKAWCAGTYDGQLAETWMVYAVILQTPGVKGITGTITFTYNGTTLAGEIDGFAIDQLATFKITVVNYETLENIAYCDETGLHGFASGSGYSGADLELVRK